MQKGRSLMKNSFGSSISVTLFGESHGPAIGAVIDGLPPGLKVDRDEIDRMLGLRRPFGSISTARKEPDEVNILSGVFEGHTTGTPLCISIANTQQHSRDYAEGKDLARPGHADFTARMKYHGYEDYRGGGHFSGRLTAALTAAGAVILPALEAKGIRIGTHIARLGGVNDRPLAVYEEELARDLEALGKMRFAVLDNEASEAMQKAIGEAAAEGDSIGGILETAVTGLPAGIGEPWFDTLEGMIAHGIFSIPGIKGIEFGGGFGLCDARGSEYNDPFYMDGERVRTSTNNNGGINGGISNGMPVIFRSAVKPTPSIFKEQDTVDLADGKDAKLSIKGRHDPAIIHRARIVVDAVTAIVTADMLAQRYGTDWLCPQKR